MINRMYVFTLIMLFVQQATLASDNTVQVDLGSHAEFVRPDSPAALQIFQEGEKFGSAAAKAAVLVVQPEVAQCTSRVSVLTAVIHGAVEPGPKDCLSCATSQENLDLAYALRNLSAQKFGNGVLSPAKPKSQQVK